MKSLLQTGSEEPSDSDGASSAAEDVAELPGKLRLRLLRWAPAAFAAVVILLLPTAAVVFLDRAGGSGAGAPVEPLSIASRLQDVTGLQNRADKSSSDGVGSFLVVGDWGWDPYVHGWNLKKPTCQNLVAQKMLEKSRELGDVQFVINVGDSFYPNGVTGKNDPQWDQKWRNVYHQELRDVPWYSVYGNHDYLQDKCACSNFTSEMTCNLIRDRTDDRNFFYMPDVNFFKEHPELGLEVVALDMNAFEFAWNRHARPEEKCALEACARTSCQEACETNLKKRARDGLRLLRDRLKESTHTNMVVFSHYPTDYFWDSSMTDMLDLLRSKTEDRHIEYFGGHRHSTDNTSTIPTRPNNNWLVGGGGGWGCDSATQGFVVGEIDANYKLRTYSVLVPHWDCCYGPPTTTTTTRISVESFDEMAAGGYGAESRRLGGAKRCKSPPMDFKARRDPLQDPFV
eukprot:TRINITY_DN7929_c1_g1_i1.p1 TRINITY_DN7929_c1_g1~~TRINITY_DN7929_c1_g1_i1.p1  ORF type:complete len:456 (+),score=74.35 TRINITY_DN7929_c1_g1_i1:59-1426(+)